VPLALDRQGTRDPIERGDDLANPPAGPLGAGGEPEGGTAGEYEEPGRRLRRPDPDPVGAIGPPSAPPQVRQLPERELAVPHCEQIQMLATLCPDCSARLSAGAYPTIMGPPALSFAGDKTPAIHKWGQAPDESPTIDDEPNRHAASGA
jgi:hypothetical protein